MKTFTPPLPTHEYEPRTFPVLSLATAENLIKTRCGPGVLQRFGKGRHKVIILPEAWEELAAIVRYGKRRAVNCYEQQLQAMGHIFLTDEKQVLVIISHFLFIYSASRGPSAAQVCKGGDDGFLERLANERRIFNELEQKFNRAENGVCLDPFLAAGGPSQVVAFCHTHPNLSCFFSPTDHANTYAADDFPAAALVIDPIRKDLKAMVGTKDEDAEVLVFMPRAQASAAQNAAAQNEAADCDTVAELSRLCSSLLEQKGIEGRFRTFRRFGKLYLRFSMKKACRKKGKAV